MNVAYKNTSKNLAFRGNVASTVSHRSKKLPWYFKTSVKFADCGGEKLANIVNSGSKLAIAPFIIAFNPLSNKDKETKVYSAWKQPIEAGIALTSQLLLLDKLDKHVESLAKKGKLNPRYNLNNITDSALLKNNQKRLDVFKDKVGFVAVLATLPLVTSVSNYLYPKLMNRIMPENKKEVNKLA